MRKLTQRGAVMCLLTMSAMFISGGAGAKFQCEHTMICNEECQWILTADGWKKICWKICSCH